ncbi:hypothetical protein P170DRAFT_406139 [Aspergillus steynii IBT 23096]|uniref:Uncharacterized protein n=1 Tax=Aspergillus steynii IBT 23096 TaxID=1392250 RepID=A0A2I2GCW7_9EURO|nr:uncharacterized protein P170DRAFT_406139 [Aspergillus steynii IBT 23096]PLB50723.1 hypothetical protein P170DRAFT_406139 [Aspergillus steynii IBT 23096]
MASTSRLTFASVWGFENTGVLVMKGRLEGPVSKAACILARYIEEQENKDLLDVPRVYRLEVPSVLHDPIPALNQNTDAQEGDLLALGASHEEEFIPHSRVTKTWVSSDGGAGCFALRFQSILPEISKLTGTEIAIVEDKGVQVSAENEDDVDDALAKISTIEKPLMCICNPCATNMGISPDDESTRFQMRYYSNLNQAAKRRILTDADLSSTSGLFQSFVTVVLAFDRESQLFDLPSNLSNPPQVGDGPGGESRIWSDFIFQEFGKGDQFNVETSFERAHSDSKGCPVDESPSHRYLSTAKAMQIDQWVTERAEIEQTEPLPEPASMPQPETSYEPTSTTNAMKPPGIKSRRAVNPVQNQSASPSKTATSNCQSLNAPGEDKSRSPRKKWKMNYTPQALEQGLIQPSKEVDKREGSALCDVASNITATKASRLPSNFDTTKYTKTKSIPIPSNKPWGNPSRREIKASSTWGTRKPGRRDDLIDTSVPASAATPNALPLMSLDQPALVPEKLSGDTVPKHSSDSKVISSETDHSPSLAGLNFETDGSSSPAPHSIPSSQEAASSSTDTQEQEKRLGQLKKILQDHIVTDRVHEIDAFTAHRPRPRSRPTRHANQVYGKEKLEEFDRIHRSEMTQVTDEVATRKYHHTMKQKTASFVGKAKGKAEVKAKRQATLEDAWGLLKKPIKKTDGTARIEKTSENLAKGDKESQEKPEKPKPRRLQADELRTNEDIKKLCGALRQTLEAAECFPGTLTLELQFGLLLIPLLPKTYMEKSVSLDEWTRIFQPQTGVAPPSTKFISRLTTSGSDADHIVDLKTSKVEGKRRIFEQDDSEFCVSYEYHCRTKSDKPIIIMVNDQGKHTLKYPTSALGGANLHFPGQIWDAHLGVSGGFGYKDGSDPEIEEAAQYLVDHIWVPPNRTLVQIYTQLPEGNKIVIDKVFMKRWTRHRYIRTEDTSPKDVANPDRASSTGLRSRSTASPDPVETTSQDSRNGGVEANSDQDIFLQVTEVQNLMIGISATDPRAVRARCATLLNMLKTGRQWYEASLVSPAIEAILKSNTDLELGERTDDWCSTDLFGNDASLVCEQPAGSAENQIPIPLSPVASAIGDAGIGSLFRLAKKIIGKMDGVGYWNYNPQADTDTVRMPPPSSLGIPPAATALTVASLKNLTAKPEPKSFSFEELESIKDVGSATMEVALTKKSSPIPSTKPMEKINEVDYW